MNIVLNFPGCNVQEKLIQVSSYDCVCPGDTVTYECTVSNGYGGTTVWKGDFFIVQVANN